MTYREWEQRVRSWSEERRDLLSYEEQHGHFPQSDAMFHNDDEAVELLYAICALRGITL